MTTDPTKNGDRNKDGKGPKIDWAGQIRYTLLMIVAIVAGLALMRYFGLRG
jgi:hypothetical protein